MFNFSKGITTGAIRIFKNQAFGELQLMHSDTVHALWPRGDEFESRSLH